MLLDHPYFQAFGPWEKNEQKITGSQLTGPIQSPILPASITTLAKINQLCAPGSATEQQELRRISWQSKLAGGRTEEG
jgi:hypothetical protein